MTTLCQCGCGLPAPVSRCNTTREGYVKGQPRPFRRGHHMVMRRIGYDVVDLGYETPCWIHAGKLNEDGYAKTSQDGRTVLRHRIAYERHVGPIPEGLVIDHLCRNRACLNPGHMEVVTPQENVRRGVFPNSAKTHCPAGHEYAGDNLHVDAKTGCRKCRACGRERAREYYHRQRLEAAS